MILFCTLLWKISGEYGWEICVYCAEYSVSGHHTFNLHIHFGILIRILIVYNTKCIGSFACELDCVFLSLTNKYHWTLQPLNTTITLRIWSLYQFTLIKIPNPSKRAFYHTDSQHMVHRL
uniref:Secreted protein n=1 Tax=Heterorhabditis bacteriophora TaxID=37862 RepID=A0A1I7WEU5_HETBA